MFFSFYNVLVENVCFNKVVIIYYEKVEFIFIFFFSFIWSSIYMVLNIINFN